MIISECCGVESITEVFEDEHTHYGDISYLGICSLCLEHYSFTKEDTDG